MSRFPIWVQRLTALAILAGLIGAIYVIGLAPLVAHHEMRSEEIADKRQRLGRYVAILEAERTALRTKKTQPEANNNAQVFLQGNSDPLILASLQSRLKLLATNNGARFQGARSLPVRAENGMRFIGVRLSVSGTAKGLRDMLHAIESGLPYLSVENAHLRRQQRNVSTTQLKPVVIVAQLDVYGAVDGVIAK